MLLDGIAGKYAPLGAYLVALEGDRITLMLAEIERIIGQALPRGARTHTWWVNTARSGQARWWLGAGWAVSARSLRASPEVITFARRSPDTIG
jgi:hypothetical protein